MLLAFVDESDHGDFHCFGAVLADESATKGLTDQLNALMAQANVDYGVPATTDFHAHSMFHGKEAWETVGRRARANLHEKVVDAIYGSAVTHNSPALGGAEGHAGGSAAACVAKLPRPHLGV
ncbi:hypothetical protein [Microlunatus sp. GCM10028923]|uniref:hypothetical protein n=1 Tax=Microlunatus sp. GCM10028923 TaxID=3273400 RepID=UPI00360C64B8